MQLKDATVLLVDDEPDLRSIIAEWFRREGCHVLVAEDGTQALSMISANPIDVVVSDVRMPVMDGITLLKKVKANGYKSSVMFLSGFTDVIKPRESYDLGIEAVMSKPVERRRLISAVTRILAERDELWRFPPSEKAEATLDATFESLAGALSQGLLALGRGGFCISSTQRLAEGPVDLLLEFKVDKRRVNGQGVVRWTASAEAQIGVEITYIDEHNRAWILSITEPNTSISFIPRTCTAANAPALLASD
ncbi:MAG TPA: response regulator [Candidatus Saccharimonadales bacterium]|jgi:CheY-like chemotaxis protein|nr:response regulator [Candidatus Saccharimonadales bacterium]